MTVEEGARPKPWLYDRTQAIVGGLGVAFAATGILFVAVNSKREL